MVTLVMRQPGEAVDSERIVAECGAAVITGLHYLVAHHLETGADPPEYARPIWDGYMKWLNETPPEIRHQRLHASHYSFVDPEEARFLTADLIRASCLVGDPGGTGRAGAVTRGSGAAPDHAVPAPEPPVPGHRRLRRPRPLPLLDHRRGPRRPPPSLPQKQVAPAQPALDTLL